MEEVGASQNSWDSSCDSSYDLLMRSDRLVEQDSATLKAGDMRKDDVNR